MTPFNSNTNVAPVRSPAVSADQNLNFILATLTRYEVSTTMLSNKMAQYFEAYQLKSGSVVKSVSELNSLLSEQLNRSNVDPLEKQIIQFVLTNPTAAHELSNFFHGDTTVMRNGSETKSQLTGILLTEAANQTENPQQANDCMLAGQAFVDGINPDSDVTNTVVIRSANEAEGLSNALQHFQRAADLGHADAQAKVDQVTNLLSQHLAVAPTLVAAPLANTATESNTEKRAKQDNANRTEHHDNAYFKAREEQLEAQIKQVSLNIAHVTVHAIEKAVEAAAAAEQRVENAKLQNIAASAA
jgi:hypothetical protein